MKNPLSPKWLLLLKTVSIVSVIVILKLTIHWFNLEVLSLNPLFAGIVAAAFFLLGFLLAGTLTDYKESERLIIELASSLDSIADDCAIVYRSTTAREAHECLDSTHDVTLSIKQWFHNRAGIKTLLESLDRLNHCFLPLEAFASSSIISRLRQEQAATRRTMLRIESIRETSFISSGYMIGEVASLVLIVGLLFAKIRPFYEGAFFLAALSFLLIQTMFLIRDLDDPFEYDPHGHETGVAEVSLKPLYETETRIKERIASLRSLSQEAKPP